MHSALRCRALPRPADAARPGAILAIHFGHQMLTYDPGKLTASAPDSWPPPLCSPGICKQQPLHAVLVTLTRQHLCAHKRKPDKQQAHLTAGRCHSAALACTPHRPVTNPIKYHSTCKHADNKHAHSATATAPDSWPPSLCSTGVYTSSALL
jgi:hypothetical protein